MIIDFKNHAGNWSLDEKRNSVGKMFYNESGLCIIVDIVDETASPVRMRVADEKGNVKRQVGWDKIEAGHVSMDFANGNVRKTLMNKTEAAQYSSYIKTLQDFKRNHCQEPKKGSEADYKEKYEKLLQVLRNYNLEYKEYEINGLKQEVLVPIA